MLYPCKNGYYVNKWDVFNLINLTINHSVIKCDKKTHSVYKPNLLMLYKYYTL